MKVNTFNEQFEWEAQPPRLRFDAPSRRTFFPNDEGVVGGTRGACAPNFSK
jgi:hypothetical protein